MQKIIKNIAMSLMILFVAVGAMRGTSIEARADIANGTSGTCSWVIDDDGVLTISPTNGTSGTLASFTSINTPPWTAATYCEQITKVVVAQGVTTATGCYGMFQNLSNCTEMDLGNLDTSSANDMSYMFYGCSNLFSLDISGLDTYLTTNMSEMFTDCTSLKTVNLSEYFRFSGAGIQQTEMMAILPIPTGTQYTGNWIRNDDSYGPYTPEDLRDHYAGSPMDGIWVAEAFYEVNFGINYQTEGEPNTSSNVAEAELLCYDENAGDYLEMQPPQSMHVQTGSGPITFTDIKEGKNYAISYNISNSLPSSRYDGDGWIEFHLDENTQNPVVTYSTFSNERTTAIINQGSLQDNEISVTLDYSTASINMLIQKKYISTEALATLPDAWFSLTNTSNPADTPIDLFLNQEDAYVVQLPLHRSFLLEETDTPQGFVTARPIEFETLTSNSYRYREQGSREWKTANASQPLIVENYEMADLEGNQLIIKKVDDEGNDLAGASMKVLESGTETVIASWTTPPIGGYILPGVSPGTTYILREESAPSGYLEVEDITFEVSSQMDVTILSGTNAIAFGNKIFVTDPTDPNAPPDDPDEPAEPEQYIVTFDKFLISPEGTEQPTASFGFDIEPSAYLQARTNETGIPVYAGPAGAAITETADFTTSSAVTTSAQDPEIPIKAGYQYAKDTVGVSLRNVQFTKPGIYRYLVTENAPEWVSSGRFTKEKVTGSLSGKTWASSSATEQDVAPNVLVLDIEVTSKVTVNNEPTGELQISGYNAYPFAGTIAEFNANGWTTNVNKSEGFMNYYAAPMFADVTIQKIVKGNQGSQDDVFSFTITMNGVAGKSVGIDSTNAGTGYELKMGATDLTSATSINFTENTNTLTLKISGANEIKFTNVPKGAYIEVNETDALDYRIESAEATGDSGAGVTGNSPHVTLNDPENTTLTITNTKNGTLPTGVNLPAPIWILAVIAGCTAILIQKKRKREV